MRPPLLLAALLAAFGCHSPEYQKYIEQQEKWQSTGEQSTGSTGAPGAGSSSTSPGPAGTGTGGGTGGGTGTEAGADGTTGLVMASTTGEEGTSTTGEEGTSTTGFAPFCGDGIINQDFGECDAGEANGTGYGQCDPQCTVNRCGDGELDVGHEQCDDGALNGSGGPGELGQAGCDLDCGFFGRRLFLSSQEFTGDMGTRAGADLACQVMATQAKFPFIFPDPGLARPFILPGGLIVAPDYPALIDRRCSPDTPRHHCRGTTPGS